MEILRYVFRKASLLWPWTTSRPNLGIKTCESSLFNQLPPELMIHITSFLPPASAALFSLSCHHILSVLGTEYIRALKENTISRATNHPTQMSSIAIRKILLALDGSSQRFQCLALLERDLPDHLACVYCEKLHAICHAPAYIRRNSIGHSTTPKCAQVSRLMLVGLVSSIWFNLSVFQMTMKRYNQGQEYLSLLNLLSGEIEYNFLCFTEHQNIRFRVVSGSLLLHKQVKFTIPPKSFSQGETFPWRYVTVAICLHSGTINSESSQMDLHRFGAVLRRAWLDWKRYTSSRQLSRCAFCASEVQIDFHGTEEHGVNISVSIWKDLGSGSLFDVKWSRHVVGAKGLSWDLVKQTRDSLRATFESAANSEGSQL